MRHISPFNPSLDVRTVHEPFAKGGWEILDGDGDYCGQITKYVSDGIVWCYDVEIENVDGERLEKTFRVDDHQSAREAFAAAKAWARDV